MKVDGLKKLDRSVSRKSNKKVINAKKVVRDGEVFDSRTERYMHTLLTMHKIPLEFQKKYVLQEKFTYNGEAIRTITYTADFEIPDADMIVDVKGVMTQQGALRIKMLKKRLFESGRNTTIELPRTKSDCNTLLKEMLDKLICK